MFWLFDLLGAAMLPGCMGVLVTAVPPPKRVYASVYSQLMINVLGMAGGAFVPGFTGQPRSLFVGPCACVLGIAAALAVDQCQQGTKREDTDSRTSSIQLSQLSDPRDAC
jgi:hypothetical protein